jgi:cytochrome c oxidase assembly protein subunit 15
MSEREATPSERRLFRFAWLNLVYILLVILWGAFVRATGSGAGCGDHWPLCNGEVIPQPERVQTVVEFLHRATSGISLILVVFGYFLARKCSDRHSAVRRAAFFSVVAIVMEALLGAGLVLLKLVEFDQSGMRAISIALHLVNTIFLIAALTTLAWSARNPSAFSAKQGPVLPRDRWFWVTLAGFLLLGMTGAITALGDTLFPATSLLEGVQQDFKAGAHFLIRLRVIHPILAAVWVTAVFVWSRRLESVELWSIRGWLLGGVIVQFLMGIVNWALMAPNWMQLVHLLVADLVFIAFWISGLMHEAGKSRHAA